MAGNFAHGSIFSITTASLTAVTNLTGISGPSMSADSVDVTAHVAVASGKVNSAVGSAIVTWVDSAHSVTGKKDKFQEDWIGHYMIIGGTAYKVVTFTSDESITLASNAGTLSGVDYIFMPTRHREFLQGLRDGGEVSIEGNFDYDEANKVVTVFNTDANGGVKACEIEFPTTPSSGLTFNGVVTGFETSEPHDDKISYTATIKITGKPNFS